MDIHEYQAKELLRAYGVPVPAGEVVYSVRAAERVADELGGACSACWWSGPSGSSASSISR